MPNPVVTGAMAMCSFGLAPSTLNFLPTTMVTVEGRPVGTIPDIAPGVNIPPFAMCSSLSNPTVAAATSAALGVLTPMPCMPTIVGPWSAVAPRTMAGGKPVLAAGSTCNCAFGGVVNISIPGAVRTQVN